MIKKEAKFLEMFPDCVYRYIDGAGNGRPAISSIEKRNDLNVAGYDAYFTVNGFKGKPDAKKNSCSSINAFFVDIDGRKKLEELEEIKKRLDPTFITETKNGFHIYWLLDEPIYKSENTEKEWEEKVSEWERVEQSIVSSLKSDPVVKDLTRILRIPDTFYWKKSGEAYKKGTAGVFKITGIYKQLANTYSMREVAEAFPVEVSNVAPRTIEKLQTYADSEKKDFFKKVNSLYPIESRPSFKKLLEGDDSSLPYENCANQALLVTASLMKQAGWSIDKARKHIESIGWHGIEKERNGWQEIFNTINSAYRSNYTFSYKNDIIAHNTNEEEQQEIQATYLKVMKDRKEKDKIRFSNYEREIATRFPYIRKNEIGIVFDYHNGVYSMVSDQELENIVLTGLYDDMLWGYRTSKNVSDKIMCLLSIIPDLILTDDNGNIVNVKNGLLNIYTKELKPHTPDYVSLVQFPVEYKPEADCPVWKKCMEAWMEGEEKQEKTKMLQQFSGYILSSSMQYDRALFLIGDGGNGKSTFVDTLAMVIGKDAVSHIDLEDLYRQFGMKGLIGKRLNVIEEVHGNYYQSDKLKKLISGEKVTIDIKYKDQFSFRPQCKFVFAVNTMPRVDDTSTATERRISAVSFKNNFRNKPNTDLRGERGILATELSGVLNWMIDGALNLKEEKMFVVTKEQTQLLSEYRQENSSVEGFIAECLEFKEGEVMSSRDIYDEYKSWCTKDGRKYKSSIAFTKEMRAYGERFGKFTYHTREYGGGTSRFEGITLAEEWGSHSLNFVTQGIIK